MSARGHTIKSVLIALFCVSGLVSLPLPDSQELKVNWWDNFSKDPSSFEEKSQALENHLNKTISDEPLEQKEKAKRRADKILRNLKAWSRANSESVTPLPPPRAIAKQYSISSIVDLHKEVRKLQQDHSNGLLQIEDQKQQLEAAKERINSLTVAYQALPQRSEEKILDGLQLIALRISLALAEESLRIEQARTEKNEELLYRRQEEEKLALQRVKITPEALQNLEKTVQRAHASWQETLQFLKEAKTNAVLSISFDPQTPSAKLSNLSINEELMATSIKEAREKELWLDATLRLAIGKFFQDGKFDKQQRKEWQNIISEHQRNSTNWKREVELDLHKTQEIPTTSETAIVKTEVYTQTRKNLANIQKLIFQIDTSQFLFNFLNKQIALQQGVVSNWFIQTSDWVKDQFSNSLRMLNRVLFTIGNTPVTFFSILRLILIILVTIWISRGVILALTRIAAKRRGIRKSVLYRINRLIQYTIITIGLLIALSSIGFDFSNFVLIASALGVGLGFGLQSIFNNFISGIIILFESQLRVGDFIELESGIRGEVKEINVRSTYVETNNGINIIIPNSEFINYKVINWTLKKPHRRIRVRFTVGYEADKDQVSRLVIEAAKKVPSTLKTEGTSDPKVYIEKLGENGIEFVLSVWIDERATRRNFSTTANYLWAIHDALRSEGITLPYPHRMVYMHSGTKDHIEKNL